MQQVRNVDLAVALSAARVIDLARSLPSQRPTSSATTEYQHHLVRRHGDVVRSDGGSSANDLIVTGGHVGTHIDALSHYSHDGLLYGGADAVVEQRRGFPDRDIHAIAPLLGRGVLLDVASALGVVSCEAGYEITPSDLQLAADRGRVDAADSVLILVRTGWRGGSPEHGAPGVGEAGARWLADLGPRAVGADTGGFEQLPPGIDLTTPLPVHRFLLVDRGVHIIENLELDELAATHVHDFGVVVVPLPLRGATGCPVRPLALLPEIGEVRSA